MSERHYLGPTRDLSDSQLAWARKQIARASALSKDPLTVEFIQSCSPQSGRVIALPAMDRPWKALGFLRLSTLALALKDCTINCEPDADDRTRALLVSSLMEAHPFLWANDTIASAVSMPVPEHIVSAPDLPFGVSLHVFETPFWATHGGDSGSAMQGVLLQLVRAADGFDYLMAAFLGSGGPTTGHAPFVHVLPIKIGSKYPSDFSAAEAPDVAHVIRLIAFLNSPYLSSTSERVPREIRRRCERSGHPLGASDSISVVTLRRESDGAHESFGGREHHHRWWVRGHIRAQWYPSLNGHKPVFIAPHLKGPEGAPMLAQVHHVTR